MQVCNSLWIIAKIKTREMSVWAKFAKISSRENFYLYSIYSCWKQQECPTIWILWRSLSAHHHWVKWHQMIYLTRCRMWHAVFWFWNLQLLETAGMPNDLNLVKKIISTPSLAEMTSDDILNKMLNAACSILILKFTAVGNCRNAQKIESHEEVYQHTIIGWNDIRWYT